MLEMLQLFLCVCFLLTTTFFMAESFLKIQPFSFPPDSAIGNRVSVTCTPRVGEKMEFKWLKNGKELTSGHQNIHILSIGLVSSLVIDPLTSDDSGNYTCFVSARGMTGSYTTKLDVLVPPSWITFPSDVDAKSGDSLLLHCKAGGKPEPSVEWKKSNGDTSDFLSVSNEAVIYPNGSLHIQTVAKSNEGLYKCNISNGIGSALVKSAMVRVIVPARFKEKFVVKTVRRGETATLKCEALGDKPLSITWTKDKAEIDFKKHTRLEKFDRDVEKGLSSELIIRTSDRKDGALYGCLAKNEYGTDERNVKLLVVEIPAQPMDVKLKEVWSRTVSITWSAPYSGNRQITKYIIQYRRDRGGPHRLLVETIPSSQTSVLLKNLQPGTPYAVTVLAENEIGQGQPSDILKLVTGEEEPSGPPTDVWLEARSSVSILVTWKPPSRELWNGELRGYFVGYKVAGSSFTYSFMTVDGGTANQSHEYGLRGLRKSTKYEVVVKAYNRAGTGPASQGVVAKTLDGEFAAINEKLV